LFGQARAARASKKQLRGDNRVWTEANKLRMRWCRAFAFFIFLLKKFYYKQIEDASQTNSAGALFAVQNTLQDDGKKANVLKPEAPFGRRKKLPAAGSAAKMTTNKKVMKNENS